MPDYGCNKNYQDKIEEEEENNDLIFEHNLDSFEKAEKEIFGIELPCITEDVSDYFTAIPVNAPVAVVCEGGFISIRKSASTELESSNRVTPTCSPTKYDISELSATEVKTTTPKAKRISIIGRQPSVNLSRKNSFVQSIRVVAGANIVQSKTENTSVVTLGLNGSTKPTFGNSLKESGPDVFASSSSLRLDTGNIRTAHLSAVLSVLQDPIQCGYLLSFCNKEHTAENLCFIMMVSRFRDTMRQDFSSWPKSWEEVDKLLVDKDEKDLLARSKWPSKRLQRATIQKLIKSIWDSFISDDAVSQICMPAKVFDNINRRIRLIDYYGPDVFTEALLDPIKTLNQDVLPRFLASVDYKNMKDRISSLKVKLKSLDIKVPAPTDSPILLSSDSITEKRVFSLDEFCRNKILYEDFLKYLVKNLGENNLLCCRMISVFEDLVNGGTVKELAEATDQAWKIYRYFVAPEAPLEISLHSRHKKELIISLASVHPQMFDELKKSASTVLTVSLNGYKFTDSYKGLLKIMKAEQAKRKPTLGGIVKKFFF